MWAVFRREVFGRTGLVGGGTLVLPRTRQLEIRTLSLIKGMTVSIDLILTRS